MAPYASKASSSLCDSGMPSRSKPLSVSRSIPIATNWKTLEDEANEALDAKRADFQDYLFYNRIMSGLKAKHSKSRCLDLRYQNQILMDHIRDTRYSDVDSLSSMEDDMTRGILSDAIDLVKGDAEDEMMFQMDI